MDYITAKAASVLNYTTKPEVKKWPFNIMLMNKSFAFFMVSF